MAGIGENASITKLRSSIYGTEKHQTTSKAAFNSGTSSVADTNNFEASNRATKVHQLGELLQHRSLKATAPSSVQNASQSLHQRNQKLDQALKKDQSEVGPNFLQTQHRADEK